MAYDYDPVAAHEYYVNYRKKGLKKGRSTKGFSDTQKEQLSYVKHQISEEKKRRDSGIRLKFNELQKDALQKLTDYAKKIREQISQRLANAKERNRQLSAVQREQIQERAQAKKEAEEQRASQKIEAIREQMKGLSQEQKAILRERISGIRDVLSQFKSAVSEGAQSEKSKASEDTKAKNAELTEAAKAERQELSSSTSAEKKRRREIIRTGRKSALAKSKERAEKDTDAAYSRIKRGG